MRMLGALRPADIDNLLGGEHRSEALTYLAACSRLMAALEPFVRLTPASAADYVARGVAAALAASGHIKEGPRGCRSCRERTNSIMRAGTGARSMGPCEGPT